MKIAMAQMSVRPTVEENLAHTLRRMERAAALDADLIFFPALQLSPIEGGAARPLCADGPELAAIRDKCRELGLCASPNLWLEQEDGAGCVSLMIGADGELLGQSRAGGGSPEADYAVYELPRGRVGVVIGDDRHRPDSLRSCVKRGAELVIIPTASRASAPLESFERELRALAVLNGCFAAMCSRAGQEGEQQFAGGSMLVGPDGRVMLKAGALDGLYIMDADPAEAVRARAGCDWLAEE